MNRMLGALAAILIAGLLIGCSERPVSTEKPIPIISSADLYKALLVCISGNVCLVPSEIVEVVNRKAVYYSVRTGPKNNRISFLLGEVGDLAVTYSKSEADQIVLEDNNLDDLIDRVSLTIEGGKKLMIYMPKHPIFEENRVGWQGMFNRAKYTAWMQVVPVEIKQSIEEEQKRRTM